LSLKILRITPNTKLLNTKVNIEKALLNLKVLLNTSVCLTPIQKYIKEFRRQGLRSFSAASIVKVKIKQSPK
jgi:hypothetical protein